MDNQAFELLKSSIEELRADVKDIKNDLGHYKGFLGGITFVFSVIWAGVTYFFTNYKSGSGV